MRGGQTSTEDRKPAAGFPPEGAPLALQKAARFLNMLLLLFAPFMVMNASSFIVRLNFNLQLNEVGGVATRKSSFA